MNGDNMVNDIYGTDINMDFSFKDGDINLVNGTKNLAQAVCNRLNSNLQTYEIFYARYGGNLLEWLGEQNNTNIQEYLKIEIESILGQEPRITSVEATVTKETSTTVLVDLKVLPITSDEIITLNLIIQEDLWVQINPNVGELSSRC